MSSIFNHIFIPLAILIIFSGLLKLDRKKIIALSFFGVLPDIDIFLFHRASFHNIFILIIPFLAFIFFFLAKKEKETEILGIINFYLLSHVILDIFNGGLYLLYPFYQNVIYARADILFDYSGITSIVDYGVSTDIVDTIKRESIMSSESTATIILLAIPLFIYMIRQGKKKYLYVTILAIVIIFLPFVIGSESMSAEKPIPSVSIGCDRVLYNDTKLDIKASTSNIKNATFQWFMDDKFITNNQTLSQKFKLGNYNISLNTSFDNQTIEKNISILVVNSTDNISIQDNQSSTNEWSFQTLYNNEETGVQGVDIYIDNMSKKGVNSCGIYTIALPAGNHTWRAEYRSAIIGSGNFTLKEVEEMKIDKIDLKPSYKVGDTVNGKITIKNSGTVTIKEFGVKTIIVNNRYSWMGDAAKKEFYDEYTGVIDPGEKYEIPISVKIPEEVSGVSPTGKYTVTVQLILNKNMVDSKTKNIGII